MDGSSDLLATAVTDAEDCLPHLGAASLAGQVVQGPRLEDRSFAHRYGWVHPRIVLALPHLDSVVSPFTPLCARLMRIRPPRRKLEEIVNHGAPSGGIELDAALRARLDSLLEEGREIWDRFDREVRQQHWHPFVAADYQSVLEALLAFRAPGLRFLEWGSATGVITIMADLLGFEAYGIELDPGLVDVARDLAERHGSGARFAVGSFLPSGSQWRASNGDTRPGTIGHGASAYPELGHPLDDFDLVYAYPWSGEEPLMQDLMQRYGRRGGHLMLHSGTEGIRVYSCGRAES